MLNTEGTPPVTDQPAPLTVGVLQSEIKRQERLKLLCANVIWPV